MMVALRCLAILSVCLLIPLTAGRVLADDTSGDLDSPPGGGVRYVAAEAIPAAVQPPQAPAPSEPPAVAPPAPSLPAIEAAMPDEPPVVDAPPAPEPPAPEPPVAVPTEVVPAEPVPTDDRAAYLDAVGQDTFEPMPPRRMSRATSGRRRWDLTLEGAVSFFEDPEGIIGEPVPPGVTPFTWGPNDYSGAFGLRGTVGYNRGGRDRFEARAMWLGSWEESSRQTGQFAFRPTPALPIVLSPAGVSATLTNETDIWGGELNWWRTVKCTQKYRLNAGVGARYLRIDDTVSATNWIGVAPNSNLVGEAENGFLALQLMGQYQRNLSPRLQFSLTVKALLGSMTNNLSESDTSIVTGGATIDAERGDSTFGWGFEGEVGALYRFSSRAGLTASYQLLVVGEVARAQDILDLSQAVTGSVQLRNATDTAVVHSFFFGIRLDL